MTSPEDIVAPTCICGEVLCQIPFGTCHCGCGGITTISKKTVRHAYCVRGMPTRYLAGHRARTFSEVPTVVGVITKNVKSYVPCRFISLTQGYKALVDESDYLGLSQWRWYASKGRNGLVYAKRDGPVVDGRREVIGMHTFLHTARKGLTVDHANGNTLDNRRSNLRDATTSQQLTNRRKYVKCASKRPDSKFKGVRGWGKNKNSSFSASITKNGMVIYGGKYRTEVEAARAYDALALIHFGEFARLNFPPDIIEGNATET